MYFLHVRNNTSTMFIHKAMVTLVLTWGMQQESFLASSVGAPNSYPLISYLERGGGGVLVDYHIQAITNLIMAWGHYVMGAMPPFPKL
jgi:hypothetical protein